MTAHLIEIDSLLPAYLWYSRYPGMRLWCVPWGPEDSEPPWRVLPGQHLEESRVGIPLGIRREHAWEVAKGEVELRLVVR